MLGKNLQVGAFPVHSDAFVSAVPRRKVEDGY